MSVKQFIPAIKYGNPITSDEVDLSGATGDVTFVAGNPQTSTQSVTKLNPAIGQTVSVTLTATQIQNMFGTPVTLVTTTAAGQAIIVESCMVEGLNTSTTFTAGGSIIVGYNGSTTTGNGVLLSTFPPSLVTSSSAVYLVQEASATTSGALVVQPNAGITIGNQTAAFATGTGTLKVNLNYYIVTL